MQLVSSAHETEDSFLNRLNIFLTSLVTNKEDKAFTFDGKEFFNVDDIMEFVQMDLPLVRSKRGKGYYIIVNIDKMVKNEKHIKKIKSLQKKKAKEVEKLKKLREKISKVFKNVKPEELSKREIKNYEEKIKKLEKLKEKYEELKYLKKIVKNLKGKEKTKVNKKIKKLEEESIDIRKINRQLETFTALINYKTFFENIVNEANKKIGLIDEEISKIEDKEASYYFISWKIL